MLSNSCNDLVSEGQVILAKLFFLTISGPFSSTGLVAPYCAIPRDYLSDIARYGVFGVSTWPIRCDTPPLFCAFPSWRAFEVEVRYSPPKGVSQWYLHDTSWKKGKKGARPPLRYWLERVSRDMGGISHWAAKSTSYTLFSVSRGQSLIVCRNGTIHCDRWFLADIYRELQLLDHFKVRQAEMQDMKFAGLVPPGAQVHQGKIIDLLLISKQGSTPTPWARGLRDQIQKWALQTQKTFVSRVFCAQRRTETMVSDHGLGRGQTMG